MPETKNANKPFDAKEAVDSFMQALKSDKLYRMVPSDTDCSRRMNPRGSQDQEASLFTRFY